MKPYDYHVLVCVNDSVTFPSRPRTCAESGSQPFFKRLMQELSERGLGRSVRVIKTHCLAACWYHECANMVTYPDGVWYSGLPLEEIPRLIDEHFVGGRPLEQYRTFTYEPLALRKDGAP